jgi:general secretion pathway protein G
MKITESIRKRLDAIRRGAMSNRGFTLIEIMIVITIIAILASLIVPRIIDYPKKARVTAAKLQMNNFKLALEQYTDLKGHYPSTEEGLQALVQEKIMNKIPNDPWGNPYQYRYPGEINPDDYEIWTYGADGREGGEGFNADIKSWEQ